MMEWHRLFGLALTDYFTGSAYRVEVEKDLSLKQQFLDVVIIEQEAGRRMLELPDGLENFARHNLLTFCAREPKKLATEASLMALKEGVYEVRWGSQRMRIIVLSQVPRVERNALWQLFSGIGESVQFGASHYRWRRSDNSGIINDLYNYYHAEGIAMPYTWDDYYRDITKDHLHWLTIEERLKGLPAEERLKGLPIEERLKGLSAKEIEAYFKKFRARKRKRK